MNKHRNLQLKKKHEKMMKKQQNRSRLKVVNK